MGGETHDRRQGALDRSISTSVRGNSTAFGFSIMITVAFGMVSRLDGPPSVLELLLYGVAAATSVMLFEAGITRGFREHVDQAAQEVQLLGTAMNFLSVAAGAAAALAVGELVDGLATWPLASAVACAAYVLAESAEIYVAELIQSARGEPHGEEDKQEE